MKPSEQASGDRGPEVPPAWLSEFQDSPAARSLERLSADLEVINDLRIHGFQGPRWEAFVNILIGYSFQVLTTWLRRGVIFEKCAQKGVRHFSGTPKLRTIPYDEAEDIAQEVLKEAITRFKTDVLIPGKWDMRYGASLKTYFIGQCLWRFPAAYAKWYSRYAKHSQLRRTGVVRLDVSQNDPALTAINRELARNVLSEIDEGTRVVLELRAQRFRIEEIAELLETTPSAIKSRLHRVKQRMREGGVA